MFNAPSKLYPIRRDQKKDRSKKKIVFILIKVKKQKKKGNLKQPIEKKKVISETKVDKKKSKQKSECF